MQRRPPSLLLIACLAAACAGVEPELPGEIGDAAATRRLSRWEFERSVQSLLGLPDVAVAADLPAEYASPEFAPPEATWGPLQVEKLLDAADAAVLVAFERGTSTGGAPAYGTCPDGDWACARRQVAALLRRAWRRPVRTNEVDRHLDVARSALAEGDAWDVSLRAAFTAVLVSAEFVFQVPRTVGWGDDKRLTGESIANRLASVFWSSLPDDALREQGRSKELDTDEGLAAAVDATLANDRSNTFLALLAAAWLDASTVEQVQKDNAGRVPFGGLLRAGMREETTRLVAHVFEADLPVTRLVDADFTFLDAQLADWYGLEPVDPSLGFVQRSLAGTGRRGVLGHGSFLAATGGPVRTNIPRRGNAVLARLLCASVDPPPPGVPPFDDSATTATSVRQRLDAHRRDPSCAGCHNQLDPLGYALDAFDTYGRARTMDDLGATLDTNVQWLGEALAGPAELGPALAKDPRFTRCAAATLSSIVYVRPLDPSRVPPGFDAWTASGAGLRSLVRSLALDDAFRRP